MPYGELIAGSFRIAWRHRYLWLLGLLAGSGGGGSGLRDQAGSLALLVLKRPFAGETAYRGATTARAAGTRGLSGRDERLPAAPSLARTPARAVSAPR